MFDVQHLVIQDVLDKPFGNVRRVESLADRDAVGDVGMMTENALRPSLRPGDRRFWYRTIEITAIQSCKHPIKSINLALRRRDHLSPATAPREIRGAHYSRGERVITVNPVVNRWHSLTEKSC